MHPRNADSIIEKCNAVEKEVNAILEDIEHSDDYNLKASLLNTKAIAVSAMERAIESRFDARGQIAKKIETLTSVLLANQK